jgi:hypothetical protein
MYFSGYVLRQGLYVDHAPDVREIMLYNGRRVLVRGPGMYTSGSHRINPGDLIQFYCGHNGADIVDFDADQEPGTFYKLSWDWSDRVTDEHTISTFMIGARILEPATTMKTRLQRNGRALKKFFSSLWQRRSQPQA